MCLAHPAKKLNRARRPTLSPHLPMAKTESEKILDAMVDITIANFQAESRLPLPSLGANIDLRHVCPTMALTMGKSPKLMVFDLDYTLWPFDCDKDVIAPFVRYPQGVIDSWGRWANPYVDVQGIIGTLYHVGIPVAYASRNPSRESVKQLLQAIPMKTTTGEKSLWDALPSEDYFHAYSTTGLNRGKDPHFAAIKKISGIEFSDMLFFDDLPQNIEYARIQGTTSVYLSHRRGLTWDAFLRGLTEWRSRHT